MIRTTHCVAIAVLLLSVCGLFNIKFMVQNLKKDLDELAHQYNQEKEAIHVLKAEWVYLNQSDRLKKLAAKYLQLEPTKVAQIKSIDSISNIAIANNQVSEKSDLSGAQAWKDTSGVKPVNYRLQKDPAKVNLIKAKY